MISLKSLLKNVRGKITPPKKVETPLDKRYRFKDMV